MPSIERSLIVTTAEPAASGERTAEEDHPGIAKVSRFLAAADWRKGTLPERRAAMEKMLVDVRAPEGTTAEPATLGGRPAEWLVPEGASRDRAVLFLHGGGYCMGSLASCRELAGRLALATGSAFATVDYRLAPEDPHPAALDDAVAAWRDLRALGFEAHQLALAGDSAGGGLAFATALALQSAGEDLPAALVALSPWTDLTQSSAAFEAMREHDPSVTKSGLDEMAKDYLAGIDPRTPLVSPVCAPRSELSGFPPVLIEVGANEVLLDDAGHMADNLRDAGVEVTLNVWPQMIHVFQMFPAHVVPEAAESIDGVGAFLAGRLRQT